MKGGSGSDSELQGIESILLGSVPNERSVFAIEVDKRTSEEGVVCDPDADSTAET